MSFFSLTSRDARPVVLAVTGHRNIDVCDTTLTGLVEAECMRLARSYRGASFLILSGLAEGADRLVVEVAQKTLAAELVAVLALPEKMFLADFEGKTSRAHFHALLAQASLVVNAPLMHPRSQLSTYDEPRNHQYAWIGAFLARRAQVLFALWDGAPVRGTGGTVDVVQWFLRNSAPRRYGISFAQRIPGNPKVKTQLLHINPETGKIRRRSQIAA